MSKPQVTLTLGGDDSALSKTFDKVGASSKKMADEVGASSKQVAEETSTGFDRAGEAADGTYSSFDALESVGRGTTDTMSGLGEIMSGNILQGSTDLAGGVAALADGFSGALLPAIKKVAEAGIQNSIATARQTAATVASRAVSLASAAATNVMAVAQRALNLAMRANPIGLIITGLLLLTAGVIWAYKNVGWFRSAVDTAMKGAKAAFGWAIDAGKSLVGWVRGLPGTLGGYFNAVSKAGGSMVKWFQDLPGRIGGFFRNVGSIVAAPFKAAFDAIRTAWNNTVGGKGFDVPGWVPGVGGKSFRIPYFHTGGIVPGGMGSETLAILRAGERVTAGSNQPDQQQPAGDVYVTVEIDGEQLQGRITKTVRTSNRELKRTVKAA